MRKQKKNGSTHAIDGIEQPNDIGFRIRIDETIHRDIVTHFRFNILWSFDEARWIYSVKRWRWHEYTSMIYEGNHMWV